MVGKMAERVRERSKQRKCLKGKEGERGRRPIWGLTYHEAYRGSPSVHVRNQTMFSAGHIVLSNKKSDDLFEVSCFDVQGRDFPLFFTRAFRDRSRKGG